MVTSRALLPEGLRDTLPPFAEGEAQLLRALLDVLAAHGFERVATPLIEFDDALDAALVSGRPHERFRFMDPASQRLLAAREDITGQIARIATTRLAHWARPLRLCYSGPVLRVRGTQLQAERQFLQLGAELIGDHDANSVIELISLSLSALRAVGLADVGVDLVMPGFAEQLMAALDPQRRTAALDALDAKDAGALASMKLDARITSLPSIAGNAMDAIGKLEALPLEPAARAQVTCMRQVIDRLASSTARLSLDPCERRGFEYQSGIGFSLFAQGIRGEVGRGGAYVVLHGDGGEEAAVGFSLYIDSLVEAGLAPAARPRLLVAEDEPVVSLAKLHAQGYATVKARSATLTATEAAAQRCAGLYVNDTIQKLKD